jgi:hypothetical protein
MTVPMTVMNSTLQPGAAFPLGSPKARCARGGGFVSARARPRGRGLGFDFQRTGDSLVTVDILQATAGRRLLARPRRVRRFSESASFDWNGAPARGRLADGIYEARITASVGRSRDTRRFVFERRGGRFRRGKAVATAPGCGTVSSFSLSSPAFGARVPLRISAIAGRNARVTVRVLRGSRVVKSFRRSARRNRTVSLRLSGARLRRGEYRVVLRIGSTTRTLYARRA